MAQCTVPRLRCGGRAEGWISRCPSLGMATLSELSETALLWLGINSQTDPWGLELQSECRTEKTVQRALGRNCRLDSDGKETSVKKRSFRIKQFPNLQ